MSFDVVRCLHDFIKSETYQETGSRGLAALAYICAQPKCEFIGPTSVLAKNLFLRWQTTFEIFQMLHEDGFLNVEKFHRYVLRVTLSPKYAINT